MTELLDVVGKIMAIILPIFGGLIWLQRRIERGQNRLLKKINKIDKRKVSYKVCDQRRAECSCLKKEA